MAALHNPSVSFLSVFLPVARASLLQPARTHPLLEQVQRRARKAINNPLLQHLQRRANNALNTSLLPAIFLPIPTLLGELWDGLLKAVPKKKTSHMKKRHRQMASGKALKDVTALNTCSSCGRQKRAHVLCEYCVKSIKQWFTNGFRTRDEVEELRMEKKFDKDSEPLDEKEDSNQTVPKHERLPAPAARRGTSNEMEWYNSQAKFQPTGQRKPRRAEGYRLLRRGHGIPVASSNDQSAREKRGKEISGRRFVPLPGAPSDGAVHMRSGSDGPSAQ